MTTNNTEQAITPLAATLVSDNQRLTFLPKFFGRHNMVRGEALVYAFLGDMSKDYKGADWHYYTLSNGGFYMAPDLDEKLPLSIPGNWFSRHVSPDAAGIIATLFALSQLIAENGHRMEGNRFIDFFHSLREFALSHSERELILAAID